MERYARSLRLKDRVAAAMAGRRTKPQEPASQEEVPTPGEATAVTTSSASSKSKVKNVPKKCRQGFRCPLGDTLADVGGLAGAVNFLKDGSLHVLQLQQDPARRPHHRSAQQRQARRRSPPGT